MILKTFFWGLAICLPAYIGNTLLFEVYRDLGISNILSSSFFGPAIVEEGLKFLVFLSFIKIAFPTNLSNGISLILRPFLRNSPNMVAMFGL